MKEFGPLNQDNLESEPVFGAQIEGRVESRKELREDLVTEQERETIGQPVKIEVAGSDVGADAGEIQNVESAAALTSAEETTTLVGAAMRNRKLAEEAKTGHLAIAALNRSVGAGK